MSSPSLLSSHAAVLLTHIQSLDNKFRRSCDQILLLNNQIEDLQIRYDRAMGANRRSFRYSIRLRLATLEGARNMFYEYASRSADKLEELQNELIVAGGEPYSATIDEEWEPVTSSDEEEMMTSEPSNNNVNDIYSNGNSDDTDSNTDSQDLVTNTPASTSVGDEVKNEGQESVKNEGQESVLSV